MKEELNDILEFLKEEIEREGLAENFESIKRKANEIINEITRREGETRDSVTKKLLAKEKEILLETVKLIQLIRFKKILELYAEGGEIRGISDEEKLFVKKIHEIFTAKKEEEKIGKYVFAVVLKEIPQFVGVSGKEYGPFKPGDIIKIDEKDLEILIRKGLVKVVKEQ
mgnify:CR=1 FL=1